MKKLCIAMVGLPAMGKSTIARKLEQNIRKEGFSVKIFNNGQVRRQQIDKNTSAAEFYGSGEGKRIREEIAGYNLMRARQFLEKGDVAIVDATNTTRKRRAIIEQSFDCPVLFISCSHDDEEILKQSISQKTKLDEFGHLSFEEAFDSFCKRLEYYKSIHEPLDGEANYIELDPLEHEILRQKRSVHISHYVLIRDILVTDWIRNLYLVRHGKSYYNEEDRIGGDPSLNEVGLLQAKALGEHFRNVDIPYIFTGERKRTSQMAAHLKGKIVKLNEFNEIDAGVCEEMTYDEIRKKYPEIYRQRLEDKYNYIYPGGEGYVSLRPRVMRGLKKALFLGAGSDHIMIVGHQALNRVILSYFLYRQQENVPYTYIPQNKYFHITSDLEKKSIRLRRFTRVC